MDKTEKEIKREKINECAKIIEEQLCKIIEIVGKDYINGKFYALKMGDNKSSAKIEIRQIEL